jgi:hypothetical protein
MSVNLICPSRISHQRKLISFTIVFLYYVKRSLKIQKGDNQNPLIEEEQTSQWPKEKGQRDKQLSQNTTQKTTE